ncbi:interferon gamma receptor 1 [Lampris incognitus]|uniref:interferon gamma receptor 1 n=1 Tax=Lampris incognitus TaxID=2546036 RepID=UPI0024B4E651|nr:interferon gamma receptor 1 [Lampris incognitus]
MSAGTFAAFSLLLLTATSATVPPPENVTVDCQNFQPVVYWNYSQQLPQTVFAVNISGSAGFNVSTTTEHQHDLTNFLWKSEQHYLDFHVVNVTAVQGASRSKSVESETFTYNHYKEAKVKCMLDFPQVELSVKDLEATVSFLNPCHLNNPLKCSGLKDVSVFYFSVLCEDVELSSWTCTTNQKFCKRNFSLQKKCCVRLRGRLYDSSSIESILFKETSPICARETSALDNPMMVLVIVVSVLGFAIPMILVIYKVWGYLKPRLDLPKNLTSWFSCSQLNIPVLVEVVPHASTGKLVAKEPYSSLMLFNKEDDANDTPTDSSASDFSSTPSPGFMYWEGSLIGRTLQDDDMEVQLGREMEEGEEAATFGYERRVRIVDMGHNNMVKCYGSS